MSAAVTKDCHINWSAIIKHYWPSNPLRDGSNDIRQAYRTLNCSEASPNRIAFLTTDQRKTPNYQEDGQIFASSALHLLKEFSNITTIAEDKVVEYQDPLLIDFEHDGPSPSLRISEQANRTRTGDGSHVPPNRARDPVPLFTQVSGDVESGSDVFVFGGFYELVAITCCKVPSSTPEYFKKSQRNTSKRASAWLHVTLQLRRDTLFELEHGPPQMFSAAPTWPEGTHNVTSRRPNPRQTNRSATGISKKRNR